MTDAQPAPLAVTLLTAAINTADAAAGLARARFVLANAAEVGVPRSWLPRLAVLKLAGAAGILLGLLGRHHAALGAVGVAAACGLTLLYVGALGFHVRARVFHNLAFPLFFLAAAVATLTLGVLVH
ncbi:DoxX family protein [Streptomyces sp. NPDC057854]|uniref:DoxX family protein n=1 Tax=unclassified Streptomyces TaxID=2593676 RepID=UPI003688980C